MHNTYVDSSISSLERNHDPLIKKEILSEHFSLSTFNNREPPHRVPQDIGLVTSAKSVPEGGESTKVNKTPSLQAEKSTSKPMKPLRPDEA
jgi:hypothetical protein